MNRPVILDYAISRKNEDGKSFVYDYSCDMNNQKGDTTKRFIEASITACLLQTKTRMQRESDDEEYNCLELLTKTEAGRERDDDCCCLELLTKTDATREGDDDEHKMYNFFDN